jgi:hypothetical protein
MRRFLALAALLLASPVAAQNYNPGALTPTNCGGTGLAANTALTVIPASTAQHGWRLENLDTTEGLWWSVTGTAVVNPASPNASGSFVIPAGAATTFLGAGTAEPGFGFGTGGALSIIATTAAHKYACIYW